jgi:hypothetical protein
VTRANPKKRCNPFFCVAFTNVFCVAFANVTLSLGNIVISRRKSNSKYVFIHESRMGPWMQKIGIKSVKATLSNVLQRKALW